MVEELAEPRAFALLDRREPLAYSPAEQRFSAYVAERLEELLRGHLNALPLLRKYHQDRCRLGVLGGAGTLDGRRLRLPVVENMLRRVLLFLHAGHPGGPVTQWREGAALVERQAFSTQFPHIILTRQDRYDAETRLPLETEWTVERTQNQRADVRINRALDAANLGLELLKGVLRREG